MSVKLQAPLPDGLLNAQIEPSVGEQVTVRDIVQGQPTLLLFVRHFGCIGCSENISQISPRFAELSKLGVRVVIIGCGAAMFIDGFMERHRLIGLPVEVYTDITLQAQQNAGLNYGAWGGFGPRALYEMVRAFVSGHVSGPIEGDIKQHAGAILVDGEGRVQLYHRAASLGDHVNAVALVDAAITVCVHAHPDLV